MPRLDHVAVWIPDRDAALAGVSAATGLPVLDGYAPEGRRVARGVRFGNGPFLDVHQTSGGLGPPLLGLGGDVAAAQAVAEARGWRSRLTPYRAASDAEPWSILAFGRGQGLLSRLFVIQYEREVAAWASPVFNGGLYHLPSAGGSKLRRVVVGATDVAAAREQLAALDVDDVEVVAGEGAPWRMEVAAERMTAEAAVGPHLVVAVR